MRTASVSFLFPVTCALLSQAQPSQKIPLAAVSVNGASVASIHRGWPLLLRIGVRNPDLLQAVLQPMAVASPDGAGPWSTSVHFQLLDFNQNPVAFSFAPAGDDTPPAQIDLDAGTIASARWTVSPEQTATLASGLYTLSAAVDWSGGTIVAPPVRIEIQDSPNQPDPLQESRHVRILANFWLWNNDSVSAQAAVQQALAASPTDIHLLELAGDIYAGAGDFDRALVFYLAACQAFERAFPQSQEPPGNLYQKKMNALIRFAGAN